MSRIKDYLRQAGNVANERFMNAIGDGFPDDPGFHFTANEGYMNAAGNQPMMGLPRSQPYIITVSNASNASSSNFNILGAYTYLNNSGFDANGNLTIGNCVISSGIPNVNYRQILYQTMNSPYTIGLTYLQCSTANQVTQTLLITTQDINGNLASMPIVPAIDPYQNQTTVLTVNRSYRLDGFTQITTTILPNAVLTIQLYPQQTLNLARGLAGEAANRAYGAPGIVRESVVNVGGDTLAARLGS